MVLGAESSDGADLFFGVVSDHHCLVAVAVAIPTRGLFREISPYPSLAQAERVS